MWDGDGDDARRDTSYQRDDDVARYRVEAVLGVCCTVLAEVIFSARFRFNGNPRVFFRLYA